MSDLVRASPGRASTVADDAALRSLTLYLRAAWSVAPALRRQPDLPPVGNADAPNTNTAFPIVTEQSILLPRGDIEPMSSRSRRVLDLASVAHAAAHLTWSTARFDPGTLRPLQTVLVGLIEDARVERLALARYPGLLAWWLPFHRVGPDSARTASALMARLARALLDPGYVDPESWVMKARARFDDAYAHCAGADPTIARSLGNLLGNDLGQMRVQFNARTYEPVAAYRDDNSLLWDRPPTPLAASADEPAPERSAAPVEGEPQPDAVREPSREATPLSETRDEPAAAPVAAGMREGDDAPEAVAPIDRYHEWDYVIRRYRANWCSVQTIAPVRPTADDDARSSPAALPASRVAALLRSGRHREPAGKLHAHEGDVLDLDACIAGRIDARRGVATDVKGFVLRRSRPRGAPLAVLLDLSASAGERIGVAAQTGALLAQALRALGRPYAIYGFHSDGRHRVRFHVFKDFDVDWDAAAHTQLMSVRPSLSTRFGAALRHTAACVARHGMRHGAQAGGRHASLLVVSDGEPFDVDSYDPKYLRADMRRALAELDARGIACGCLALDAGRVAAAAALFGRERVALLRDASDLAGALGRLGAVLR
ncbi:hypothetical protein C7405_105363 [Paraburkholderia caballeronis]|uniref:nitric oxide reductase activation protein NorD n=1 Tax=Paraburkholderia caballeronis TaxID=416943 RepID=UPI0010646AE4|nr:hypothetical protein [Paraburkholderia caballeronis]TDV35872.1 hypothetical protein C7405_105363 [Paraburkholderia caballeronis]